MFSITINEGNDMSNTIYEFIEPVNSQYSPINMQTGMWYAYVM